MTDVVTDIPPHVTERKIRRAIRSARKEGLSVGGITSTGIVLVYTGDRPAELSLSDQKRGSSWDDV